jgi:hypothetical protein
MKGYIAFSILLVVVLLIGCSQKRTGNQELIEEFNRCVVAGMDPQQITSSLTGEIVGIQCAIPKGRLQ